MLMDPSSIYDKRCCYDAHLFLEPPAHDIFCCVDGRVAKDAVRSRACGHIFGMQCILEYLVNHESCPKCGVGLDCTMLEPSEVLRTHILKSIIRCPTGPSHCEWRGPMSEMMVHLHSDQCGVPRTQCPFCQQTFDTQFFEQQHKSECPEALVLCPHCDEAVERKFIGEHKQECAAAVAAAKKKKMQEEEENNNAKVGARRGVSSSAATVKRGAATTSRLNNNSKVTTTTSSSGRRLSKQDSLSSDVDATLTPSTSQKLRSSSQHQQQNGALSSSAQARRPSSSVVKSNNNNNGANVVAARPNSAAATAAANPHELSLRSPVGAAATRRLLDESAFMNHHNQHQQLFPPRALSPGQLQQWRTMTVSSAGAGDQNNNSQLMSYNNSMMSQSSSSFGHQMVSGSNNFGPGANNIHQEMSILIHELSRVGQKCSDLEGEVEELKRSNIAKDSQINILTMQLKKVEEQVVALLKTNSKEKKISTLKSIHDSSSGGGLVSDSDAGENNFSISNKLHQVKRPSSSTPAMRRNNSTASTTTTNNNNTNPPPSSSSTARMKSDKAPNSNNGSEGLTYSSRNKNYRGGGGDVQQQQQKPSNNDVYKLPSDVVREVRRTSQSEDVNSLVRGGATPQTNKRR